MHTKLPRSKEFNMHAQILIVAKLLSLEMNHCLPLILHVCKQGMLQQDCTYIWSTSGQNLSSGFLTK